MTKRLQLMLATGFVAMGVLAGAVAPAGAQEANPAQEMARVQDLKSQAFQALRVGEFDRSCELLDQAEAMSNDPALAKMKDWLADYQARASVGKAERQKQYEKSVENVRKLKEADLELYALNFVADAYLHADDKDAFRDEAWVKQSLSRMAELAEQLEAKGDLLNARRLYTALSTIETLDPTWRNKINTVSRKLNLVAMYSPDTLEAIYKSETEIAKRVEAITDPEKAAKAATRPVDEDDAALNEEFRIDWRQMLSGIKADMLREALEDAAQNYYRETQFPELVTGGVTGLLQFAETPGLDQTFPGLADAASRQAFANALEEVKAAAGAVDGIKDKRIVGAVLKQVLDANRNTVKLPEEVVIYEFAVGATNVLDPFTNVIWPYDLGEFQKSTQGEFIGVGIQIQSDEDGYLRVVSPLSGSPAYKAGIHADDVVTHINGKNAKGVTTIQAVKAITGPKGSSVTLTIRSPDGAVKDFELKRDRIEVASVKGWSQKPGGSWDWLVDADQGIGYVRLTQFTKDSTSEIRRAVEQIRKQQGKAIILDLRHNPGGLLTAATEIADNFLARGNIVSTRSAKGVPTAAPVNARPQADDVDLPVIVLVNQYSASASEIVSGALKDHSRALIVGERTFGKGSVQMLFPLEDKEAYLKLTTSHYYLPSGRCLHREDDSTDWGVDPDVTVEMTPQQMRTVLKMRQELDVLRDTPTLNPTTLPAEFKSREEQLLASDPQLSAAVLMLRMQLLGGSVG
jgi:carboxyl-terminal processing protease